MQLSTAHVWVAGWMVLATVMLPMHSVKGDLVAASTLEFPDSISDLTWISSGSHAMLVTRDGGLFRSGDAGKTWVRHWMTKAGLNNVPEKKDATQYVSNHFDSEDLEAGPGEACWNSGSGPSCDPGSWCDIPTNKCYEECESTATRNSHQIPRMNEYFCDYGSEDPIVSDEKKVLPEIGDKCAVKHRNHGNEEADSAFVEQERCSPGAYCEGLWNICKEVCLDTPTRKGRDIPLKNSYFCDYGDEEPSYIVDDGAVGKRCSKGVHPDDPDTYSCVSNAYCDPHALFCYERCVDTATRKGADIPRKKDLSCDYGEEAPKKAAAGGVAGITWDEKIGEACSGNNGCNADAGVAWCNPRDNTCYAMCYDTATRSGAEIPRKNKYWCDYGEEQPMVEGARESYEVQKDDDLGESAASYESHCPSRSNKGKLPCHQEQLMCEDVYSQCQMVVPFHPVREACHAMGCPAKLEVDSDWWAILEVHPHPAPAQKDLVFLVGKRHYNWFSLNGGATYSAVGSSIVMRGLKWHPVQPWALAYEPNSACTAATESGEVKRCYGNLVLTKDGGSSWTRILEKVKWPNYAWMPREGELGTGDTGPDASGVLAVRHEDDDGPTAWDPRLHLVYSHEFFQGKNTMTLIPHGNNFAVMGIYVFVAVANTAHDVSLMVSTNHAETFTKVDMPGNNLAEMSYSILDTIEQSCFIVVRTGSQNAKHAALYQSDESATQLTLSLRNVHYQYGRPADIAKLHSVDGVYLANTVRDSAESGEAVGGEQDMYDQGVMSKELRQELVTKISFDGGRSWAPLAPPRVDSQGRPYPQCVNTNEPCYLHLFFRGNPAEYAPIYSVPSATGIVMGVGVVAPYMTEAVSADEVSLFLSRDAGRSWTEIRKGASTYEMTDYGGLLVAAAHKGVANEVLYSWNEGLTWKSWAMSKPMEVTQLRTDEDGKSLQFMVLGHFPGVEVQGAAVNLDFTTLHERPCHGSADPNMKESDYEFWSPRDGLDTQHPKCLLGRTVVYKRRKQDAQCYNEVHDTSHEVNHCNCTEEDYECAPGFARREASAYCVVEQSRDGSTDSEYKEKVEFEEDMLALYRNPALLDVMCKRYGSDDRYSVKDDEFSVSSGYRRVPGNTCNRGLDQHDTTMACPKGGYVFYFLEMVLCLVILVGLGCVCMKGHKQWTDSTSQVGVKYARVGVDETGNDSWSSSENTLFDNDDNMGNDDFGPNHTIENDTEESPDIEHATEDARSAYTHNADTTDQKAQAPRFARNK